MLLAIYGRTFGGLIFDGWLDCAFMTIGVFLWIYQPTNQSAYQIPGQLDICKNCAAKKLFDESLK